ncbi:MAG: chemotaxis-specific protein-glutamate methyltransferase CheB [Cyanobacteria bacterium P01_D01_bin.123]
MPPLPVKVLLVEDSPIARDVLRRLFASAPQIELVGVASSGCEALSLIPQVDPEVVCTDYYMKGMDGLELARQIMALYPRPILAISVAVGSEDTQIVGQLLQAGVLDVFPKPAAGLPSDYEKVKASLIAKIETLAGVKVFTRPLKTAAQRLADALPLRVPLSPSRALKLSSVSTHRISAIAVGASTGGPQATHAILSQLPSTWPTPIFCTQHISEGFLTGLTSWMNDQCDIRVKIAEPGELALPGTAYYAPDNFHLEIEPSGRLKLADAPPIDRHRPSITAMFQSVALKYGRSACGILLTGMGRDGADGMKAIASAGGLTIAQDEDTSVVFGMPKEAIALGAIQNVLPITDVAPCLLDTVAVSP